MFTGIVKAMGKIEKIKQGKDFLIFGIKNIKFYREANLGSSICVDGVCLTVFKKYRGLLLFAIMQETLHKTVLGEKRVGDLVNLENSLKVGDELGGHFVYGHVNTVASVTKVQTIGKDKLINLKVDNKYKKYLVVEGSIAVDGTSLTIARVKDNIFTISLVEYTLQNTTLGKLQKGDKTNIEFDMMLKYLANLKNISKI